MPSSPPDHDSKRSGIPRSVRRTLADGGIHEQRVVAAIDAVPGERFRLANAEQSPDADHPGDLRSSTAPALHTIGRMIQALDLRGYERVLDVGTGSGYRAALLSRLAREVYTIEIDPVAAESARRTFAALGYTNIDVLEGDGSRGWPAASPFQAILVGGAVLDVPEELLQELDDGGRLVVPIGSRDGQLVVRFCKRRQALDSETVTWSALEPLVSRAPARVSRYPWIASPPPSSSDSGRGTR